MTKYLGALGALLALLLTVGAGPLDAVPAVPIGSFQLAKLQLAVRGVVDQRLRQVDGVWEFRCAVADPGNPGIFNVYQASAPGENGVAAMRLVIMEIDARSPQ